MLFYLIFYNLKKTNLCGQRLKDTQNSRNLRPVVNAASEINDPEPSDEH